MVPRPQAEMRPCEDWGFVLDRLAAALLVPDSVSEQPLLVAAALHPAGHLLAREVVTCANLFGQARRGLSCALQQHLDTLRNTIIRKYRL